MNEDRMGAQGWQSAETAGGRIEFTWSEGNLSLSLAYMPATGTNAQEAAYWLGLAQHATKPDQLETSRGDQPLAVLDGLADRIPADWWKDTAGTSRHDVMGEWMSAYGPAQLPAGSSAGVEVEPGEYDDKWDFRITCYPLSLECRELVFEQSENRWSIAATLWEKGLQEFDADPLDTQKGQFITTYHRTADVHAALSAALHNLPADWLQESNTDSPRLLTAWFQEGREFVVAEEPTSEPAARGTF